jgi:hypothetical protein
MCATCVVEGKKEFVKMLVYISGVKRDSASERIKSDKFAFDGRNEIG